MTLKSVPKKVVVLDCPTRLNIPVQRVLDGVITENLEDIVILGKKEDGEYFFASSIPDGGTVLWMMEKLKKQLLDI